MSEDNRFPPTPGMAAAANRVRRGLDALARRSNATGALLAALKRYVSDYDEENPPDDMPDAGCIECTVGTVPDNLNTGLCKYHAAREAIFKAEGGQ